MVIATNDAQRDLALPDGREWLARIANRRPVVVLIPIFNGLKYVHRLFGCKALWDAGLDVVAINDASTDPGVSEYLTAAARDNQSIHIVTNERNLGFVESVNRGLRLCPNSDVIILNSDTLVGAGWATDLARIAYAYNEVAAVSPLSNAAGFFSVPCPREQNDMPSGTNLEICTDSLRLGSPKPFEVAPAASGFAMYMRRSAISKVGVFDSDLFYRGYGEETDFCCRARRAGLINLIALTRYVYHEREGSFGAEKKNLKIRNSAVLKAMDSHVADLKSYESVSVIEETGKRFAAFCDQLRNDCKGQFEVAVGQDGASKDVWYVEVHYGVFVDGHVEDQCVIESTDCRQYNVLDEIVRAVAHYGGDTVVDRDGLLGSDVVDLLAAGGIQVTGGDKSGGRRAVVGGSSAG